MKYLEKMARQGQHTLFKTKEFLKKPIPYYDEDFYEQRKESRKRKRGKNEDFSGRH